MPKTLTWECKFQSKNSRNPKCKSARSPRAALSTCHPPGRRTGPKTQRVFRTHATKPKVNRPQVGLVLRFPWPCSVCARLTHSLLTESPTFLGRVNDRSCYPLSLNSLAAAAAATTAAAASRAYLTLGSARDVCMWCLRCELASISGLLAPHYHVTRCATDKLRFLCSWFATFMSIWQRNETLFCAKSINSSIIAVNWVQLCFSS